MGNNGRILDFKVSKEAFWHSDSKYNFEIKKKRKNLTQKDPLDLQKVKMV